MIRSTPWLASTLFAGIALGLSSARASAQTFLDGTVVDSLGNPVPGVNLDIKKISGGGGTPNVLNDGTDALGHFHMTIQQTQATGFYEVTFYPPQPPASTSLVSVLPSVVVNLNTTVNLGTFVLDPGVSISGHVQNTLGAPVAGVNFDVIDAGGNNLTLAFDQSDALGNFAFAAPAGSVALRYLTDTVPLQTLAPREDLLTLSGNVNVGTVVLQPGFSVSAIVRNPSNVALANVDLDVLDSATHVKVFTPNDNTNATGLVTVVVPAGTYDFDFAPPVGTHLAPARVAGRAIAANASLGIVICRFGHFISGVVRNTSNVPVANVNIDVKDSLTGVDIPLSNDVTNGAGAYSVLVPAGTYNVKFRPGANALYSDDIVYNVPVAADTVVNGTLRPGFSASCFGDGSTPTACPCGNSGAAGRGCANSANPSGALLEAEGSIVVNPVTGTDTVVLHVSGAPNIVSIGGIFLQGDAYNAAGSVFGDGVLCLSGTLIRLASKALPGGVGQFPEVGNPSVSVRGGVTPGSGAIRWYSTYYRNSSAAFCPPSTFNVSNAIRITW
ncbi:MAG: carboxypeptidase regulatory-like domain-containing protein [Planctomycetes bacterium]|nr:carboxypeptidase regulatory-like domain-containing protein [Planctomycetota bacterium]